jgi:predicted ATPase
MIHEIYIQNLKAWRGEHTIQLGRLTGFWGTNSSGKTSLLQALLLLKQTIETPSEAGLLLATNSSDGQGLDLGQPRDLISKNASLLGLGLTWDTTKEVEVFINTVKGNNEFVYASISQVTFATKISVTHESEEVQKISYESSFEENKRGQQIDADLKAILTLEDGKPKVELFARKPLKKKQGQPTKDIPKPSRIHDLAPQAIRLFQDTDFVNDLRLELETFLKGYVFYLGPLRDYPKRSYGVAGQPKSVGTKGEYTVAMLAARGDESITLFEPKQEEDRRSKSTGKGKRKTAKPSVIPSLNQKIAQWLREMNLIHSFKLHPLKDRAIYELRVQRYEGGPEVLITDVGFGVSQILPILVLCYTCPVGATLILEQPEIHLHPSVQAVLADVFIEVIKTRNVQIILESHSEHLLVRLQRRIAEMDDEYGFSEEDIRLYFCDRKEGEAYSQLKPLEINAYGTIQNWPENFFGNMTEELYIIATEGIKRKIALQESSNEQQA